MPSFEYSNSQKSAPSFDTIGFDKILAIFNRNDQNQSVQSKNSRVKVYLKNALAFENAINTCATNRYQSMAGGDLATIFMPYETIVSSGNNSVDFNAPAFYSNIPLTSDIDENKTPNTMDLQPFYWDSSQENYVFDRWKAQNGDALPHLLSGPTCYGNVDEYRDVSDIRGIGIRLPQMGVGWGYTIDGYPWPSGSDPKTQFAGNVDSGFLVDPSQYIAAPIDLRYDTNKHVWTAPRGFFAMITGFSGLPDGTLAYSWVEREIDDEGFDQDKNNGREGTYLDNPAFEANGHEGVAIGTVVWMKTRDRIDNYIFDRGLTQEADSQRFEFNNAGYFWKSDIYDWKSGQKYVAGQLIKYNPLGSQFTATQDHVSTDDNRPGTPGSLWGETVKSGVSVSFPMYDRNGRLFPAHLKWDSHGHLTDIIGSSSSSGSSTSGSSGSSSSGSSGSSSSESSSSSGNSSGSSESSGESSTQSGGFSSTSALSTNSEGASSGFTCDCPEGFENMFLVVDVKFDPEFCTLNVEQKPGCVLAC